MKQKSREEWIEIANKDNKKRFYKFFIGIPILTGILTGLGIFFNITINENQFFWILGSIVQGFAAFFGVVIALFISRPVLLKGKKPTKEIEAIYVPSLARSSFTIFYSMLGMVIYSNLTNNGRLIFVILACLTAAWSILEIIHLSLIYLFEKSFLI